MPIYEFVCKNCEHQWDELTKYDPASEHPDVKCPECRSVKKERLIGIPNFNFSNPIGTGRWTSDGVGHDYRHNWNIEHRVRPERKRAEETSHMGPNPYSDTTEEDIKLDGKILDRD